MSFQVRVLRVRISLNIWARSLEPLVTGTVMAVPLPILPHPDSAGRRRRRFDKDRRKMRDRKAGWDEKGGRSDKKMGKKRRDRAARMVVTYGVRAEVKGG